jgi:hypothetical protein
MRLFETISVECAATIYNFDLPAKDHVDGPYRDSETEEPEA